MAKPVDLDEFWTHEPNVSTAAPKNPKVSPFQGRPFGQIFPQPRRGQVDKPVGATGGNHATTSNLTFSALNIATGAARGERRLTGATYQLESLAVFSCHRGTCAQFHHGYRLESLAQ